MRWIQDVEMLEDKIVAAIGEAQAKADAENEAMLGRMTGGMGF